MSTHIKRAIAELQAGARLYRRAKVAQNATFTIDDRRIHAGIFNRLRELQLIELIKTDETPKMVTTVYAYKNTVFAVDLKEKAP